MQAYQDGLTGINNRRGAIGSLESYLQNESNANNAIALLMIDIDKFKQINDTHGHLIGDKCLIVLADCISKVVRDKLDIVARYGGEEFLIVLTDIKREHVAPIAEKIRASVEQIEVVTEEGKPVPLKVIIGWQHEPLSASTNTEALIKSADQALYVGKNNGRNQVVESQP
ncbi:GGDEF domain-containing protein [Glaciecola petra]|uniref:diguanylate cyclase n=1 Tax=Glaciecola petra TaxID=3075602 RepID=A0ABU2ZT80_9ALTE|nr:GGDEF domain-containing protein [Aestuariibacter sp. P117]MDT0595846.1 GGDEF domain-containing protein [Aestuariibacter sp. P117]